MAEKKIAEIEIVKNRLPQLADAPPFVKVERLILRHRYTDGTSSRPYHFDMVTLPHFADAVAVVVYHVDKKREIWVGVRESIRPSIYLRKLDPYKKMLDKKEYLTYLEIVAGGIEHEDLKPGGIGIDGRAALEVLEEAGFEVNASDMENLGGGVFSSPGSGKEKIHFRAVQVDPKKQKNPKGDGHPLEEAGHFMFMHIRELIEKCEKGDIEDSKTEIGARRLAARLGYIVELGMWADELPYHFGERLLEFKTGS